MEADAVGLSPETERLAVSLSVAARIEPELIRAVRLETLPGLDVGHESELWFSDWVARGPESISLRGDLLPGLRDRLAALIAAAGPGDPILRIGDIVADLHTGLSAALRIEEEINWLAVSRAPGHQEAIDESLEAALRAMVDDRRDGIADWYAGAAERLPAVARATKSAWLLAAVAARRYPQVLTSAGPAPDDLATHELARIGTHLGEALLGLAWDGTDLVILGNGGAGQVGIPVPDTAPRLVDVIIDGRSTTIRVGAADRVRVPVPERTVRLRTAFGTVFDVAGSAQFAFVRGLAGQLGDDAFQQVREALPATGILAEMARVAARSRAGHENFEVSLSPVTLAQVEPFLAGLARELGDAFGAAARQEGWWPADAEVRVRFTPDASLRPGQFRVVVADAGPTSRAVPEPPRGRPATDEVVDWFEQGLTEWLARDPAAAERIQRAVPPVNILRLLLWEAERRRVIVAGDTVRVTLPDAYRVRLSQADLNLLIRDARELCTRLGAAVDRLIMLRGWEVVGGAVPVQVRFESTTLPAGRFEVVTGRDRFAATVGAPTGRVPRDLVNSFPRIETADGAVHGLVPGRNIMGNGPDATVSLSDPWIAAEHAEILLSDMEVRIRRLSMTNGILVNGQAVDDLPLLDGDEIALGGTTVTYRRRNPVPPAAPPADGQGPPTTIMDNVGPAPHFGFPAGDGQSFRRRAVRRGYKVDEVDAFLERARQTVNGEASAGDAVTADQVDGVVFRVRFGGYDEWQVDLFLDRLARYLRAYREPLS